jgi:hypothetical protein
MKVSQGECTALHPESEGQTHTNFSFLTGDTPQVLQRGRDFRLPR